MKKRPQRLGIAHFQLSHFRLQTFFKQIIHLRTPASDAYFLIVFVDGRGNYTELQYHGLHPWLL